MRHRLLGLFLACVSLVAAGCDFNLLTPSGPAPLRYRDEVFANVTRTNAIVFGSAVDQNGTTVTLRLDKYEPTGDAATARPAIVWVHGGSFSGGSRTSPELVDEATVFARKGYVNVSVDYRLWSGGCFPVTAQCLTAITQAKWDTQAAVRYLRANAAELKVDPNRIAVAGTSAGAITALNVGYGPEDVGTSGSPGFPSTVQAAVSLSGAAVLTTPNPGEAAALLFHGDADPLVPYQSAVNTVNAANAAGLVVNLTTWPGEGHVPYVQHRQQILDQTRNFLYWMLDLAHAPQNVP
jgi:carboxylesterase type B